MANIFKGTVLNGTPKDIVVADGLVEDGVVKMVWKGPLEIWMATGGSDELIPVYTMSSSGSGLVEIVGTTLRLVSPKPANSQTGDLGSTLVKVSNPA